MRLSEQLDAAAAVVRAKAGARSPRVGLILGSGLGALAAQVGDAVRTPFAEIPHLGTPSVQGHAGQLVLGSLFGVEVALLEGRLHGYEGFSAAESAFPARLLCWLGIKALVLTNAAGGIRAGLRPGELLLITDHLNLSGANPLQGPNDARVGPRFPDMGEAYSLRLRAALKAHAAALSIPVQEGVYAMVAGPAYETPAEVRMLRALGADCVGMSTVPETLVARHQGVNVLGLSCISNAAAGLGSGPLSHQDVQAAAGGAVETLGQLLAAFLPDAASM